MFIPLLACIIGASHLAVADSIGWDAGQPNPNPGGKGGTLDGSGPYVVGTGHTLGGITFYALLAGDKLPSFKAATTNQGKWSSQLQVAPGSYLVWASMDTTDGKGNIIKTPTPGVNVKVK